jgi:hypothetical protein
VIVMIKKLDNGNLNHTAIQRSTICQALLVHERVHACKCTLVVSKEQTVNIQMPHIMKFIPDSFASSCAQTWPLLSPFHQISE